LLGQHGGIGYFQVSGIVRPALPFDNNLGIITIQVFCKRSGSSESASRVRFHIQHRDAIQ
jgi:hypothetical protein